MEPHRHARRRASPTPAGFAVVLADLLRQLGHSTAHVAGNSVGGWTALEMAKLGAARSVVALSPAGLWARRAPLYDVLSLRGTRRFSRLFDFLMPVLLSRPLWRKLMMWQKEHRPPRTGAAQRRRRDGQGVCVFSRLRRALGRNDLATLRQRAFDLRPPDHRLRGEGPAAPPAPVAPPGSAAAADTLVRTVRLRPRTDLRRSRPGC
jgi:pimeloyl-ACP methyl ester carboxylesterase